MADIDLCKDSKFSHITYCRDYDTKNCTKICYYARKQDFLKQGLDNLEVESYVEEIANAGIGGKYGE